MDTFVELSNHVTESILALSNVSSTFMRSLETATEMVAAAIERTSMMWTIGNGGSAADAQHLAAELVGRFNRDRPGIRAIALTTDTSLLTAWSNDRDFNDVFGRQVRTFVSPGDVLVAFSTSGRSVNVVRAMREAKERGAVVIGFTREGGGEEFVRNCDVALLSPSESTAITQQIHQVAYHAMCRALDGR